jgi:hypothetical protein
VFGQVMAQVLGIHSGPVSYLTFITPGILAQSGVTAALDRHLSRQKIQ